MVLGRFGDLLKHFLNTRSLKGEGLNSKLPRLLIQKINLLAEILYLTTKLPIFLPELANFKVDIFIRFHGFT